MPVNLSMTPINKAKAWGVHAVTASGVILALLALLALVDNKPQACLLWLGLALLVDGLDAPWRASTKSRKCCRISTARCSTW